MDKIDLHSIRMQALKNLNDIPYPGWTPAQLADESMKLAIRQALVLASEKATATAYSNQDGEWAEINEQSILDIEKLIV